MKVFIDDLCSASEHGEFVKEMVQLQEIYMEYMRIQMSASKQQYQIYRRDTAFLSTTYYHITSEQVYQLFPDSVIASFLLSSQTYYKLAASQRLHRQNLQKGRLALSKLQTFINKQLSPRIIDFPQNLGDKSIFNVT